MRDEETFAGRVTRLGVLADPVRRALYRFVAAQRGPVSRDQAADGVEVPRHTAKHHLDRLVDEGLLVTEFRRLTGRTGPGAGRPAKLYRRADTELEVSLPERHYDLAGEVLADAVERSLGGTPLEEAVHDAAVAAGARIAEDAPAAEPGEPPLLRLGGVLAGHGYEPRVDEPAQTPAQPPARTSAPARQLSLRPAGGRPHRADLRDEPLPRRRGRGRGRLPGAAGRARSGPGALLRDGAGPGQP